MSEDHLLSILGQVLASYSQDTPPGLHPIEIIDGAERGFTRVQARLILQSGSALDVLRRHWDRHAPTEQIRAGAAEITPVGLLTREVLRATGHERDVRLPEEELQRMLESHETVDAGKGPGEAPGRLALAVEDEHTGATVVLAPVSQQAYRLMLVPEIGAGTVRIVIKWAPTEFTVIQAQLEVGRPFAASVHAPCDDGEPIAISIRPVE